MNNLALSGFYYDLMMIRGNGILFGHPVFVQRIVKGYRDVATKCTRVDISTQYIRPIFQRLFQRFMQIR